MTNKPMNCAFEDFWTLSITWHSLPHKIKWTSRGHNEIECKIGIPEKSKLSARVRKVWRYQKGNQKR